MKREDAFGAALGRLFVQAGRPTLRAASSACSAAGTPTSPQRISDWRNGRHLPHEFSTVQPLLLWLTTRAVGAGEDDVLTMPQWRELWAPDAASVRAVVEPKATAELSVRPFPGLASLTAADRAVYFGRDDLVTELGAAIADAASISDGSPRVVIVAGVSGAGKSSLLGAGLANAIGVPTPRRATIDDGGLNFTCGTEADAADGDATDRLLVIDQFEDVFTYPAATVREVVAEIERHAADGVVVVGVRADFFGHCVEFPTLARAWQRRCVIVTEMTDGQLRDAITGPVKVAGGRIESGLADVMISDLHATSGVGDRAGRLPLLAHVLQVTWSRRSGNRMTISAYRASGGIARAVADTAETAWSAVDPDDHDLARALLMALIHVGPSGVAMRSALTPATLERRFPTRVAEIIDVFAQARLLTVSRDSIMLIHDVVLTAWPRLSSWIAADMESHLWRQQLDADTDAWTGNDRHASYLYTGSRLEMALFQRTAVSQNYRHLLTADNEAFLDAAVDARRGRRLVRGGAITLVAILAVISMIAAAISFKQARDLTTQRNEAEHAALMSHIDSLRSTNPSVAARLLLAAEQLYPDDSNVAGRILGAANSPLATTLAGHDGPIYDVATSNDGSRIATASGDRTVRIWVQSDRSNESTTGADRNAPYRSVAVLDGFDNYVTAVTFHPSLPLIAASSGDGKVRVWDISDLDAPRVVATLGPGNGRTVYQARFSPDGSQLATSCDDGTITIYRVTDGVVDAGSGAEVAAHGAAVRTLSYRPDSRVLASGGDDQVVYLWDVANPAAPVPTGPSLSGFPSITHAVAFSPDGTNLAVTGDSANAQIWDVADLSRPRPLSTALPNTSGGSWSIAYAPDGRRLASARSDGTVAVWNTVQPRDALSMWSLQHTPVGGTTRTFSSVFTTDGSRLIVGRDDGGLDVWQIPPSVHTGQGGTISSISSSPAGDLVATTGTDTMLTLWHRDGPGILDEGGRIAVQRKVNDRPHVSVSHDGAQVATANNNGGLVQLWDTTDPDRPRPAAEIETKTRYTSALDYSPVDDVLAAGSTDTGVQLWDTSDPHRLTQLSAPLTGPTDLIRSIAFNADGTRLAVSADDSKIYVYDLDSPSTTPFAVIDDNSPAQQVAFTSGGELVVAGRDLSAWRIDDAGGAHEVARETDQHASTLSVGRSMVLVGTSTHQLVAFSLTDDGWHAGPNIKALTAGESAATYQLAPRAPSDAEFAVGGDSSGSLYQQTTETEVAREWICSSTPPLTEEQRESLLPHEPTDDGC